MHKRSLPKGHGGAKEVRRTCSVRVDIVFLTSRHFFGVQLVSMEFAKYQKHDALVPSPVVVPVNELSGAKSPADGDLCAYGNDSGLTSGPILRHVSAWEHDSHCPIIAPRTTGHLWFESLGGRPSSSLMSPQRIILLASSRPHFSSASPIHPLLAASRAVT